MESFIGMIALFGFNFAPRSWAFCDGQTIAISQNQAMFALLGTSFGGDGRTNFKLPDLRSRAAVGMGTGPGLAPVQLGQTAGQQQATLTTGNMPSHSHSATFAPDGGGGSAATGTLSASTEAGTAATPSAGGFLATVAGGGAPKNIYVDGPQTATVELGGLTITGGGGGGTVTVDPTGNGQALSILNPVLGINYSIVMEGLFPSRN